VWWLTQSFLLGGLRGFSGGGGNRVSGGGETQGFFWGAEGDAGFHCNSWQNRKELVEAVLRMKTMKVRLWLNFNIMWIFYNRNKRYNYYAAMSIYLQKLCHPC